MGKSSVSPLVCEDELLQAISHTLSCHIIKLPITYLGLPLHFKKARKEDFQSLIEKIRSRLAAWKVHMLTQGGRLILVQSVLSAIAIFHLLSLEPPPWVFKAIDKIRRAFLWKGTNTIAGGKCSVNWKTVCQPKSVGGLGILNLEFMSTAFQVRWAWKLRAEEVKPWCLLASPVGEDVRHILNAAAKVVIGNGQRCFFWLDKWINGKTIEDIAPDIYKIISPLARARRTVAQALQDASWIDDIRKSITINMFLQVIEICEVTSTIHLVPDEEDIWSWSWDAKGIFTTKSVYQAHFKTKITCDSAKAIWYAWAPLRCKIAIWLILRGRIWTADRLAKRGLPHNAMCVMCNVAPEDAQHLFSGCVVTNIIWSNMLNWAGLQQVVPLMDRSLREWWQHRRARMEGTNKTKLNSMVILVAWSIWRERNARVFDNAFKPVNVLIDQIMAEGKQWSLASAGRLIFP
jgi:hypothetical protein